jgi:hypothetical protein
VRPAGRKTLHNQAIKVDDKIADDTVPFIAQTKLPIDIPTECHQATILTQIEKAPAQNFMHAERIAGCACESDPSHPRYDATVFQAGLGVFNSTTHCAPVAVAILVLVWSGFTLV